VSGDGLDTLSNPELVDRVRAQAGQLAVAASQQGELSRALERSEQDREHAFEQARQVRAALEREVATSAALREERETMRREMETAVAQARAAQQAGSDDRSESSALRSGVARLEETNRELRGRLESARGHLQDALAQLSV
jgi:chromosome segregation ATPase